MHLSHVIVDGKKVCSMCKNMVSVEGFYKGKSKSGLDFNCKACLGESHKLYRVKNPDFHRNYYLSHAGVGRKRNLNPQNFSGDSKFCSRCKEFLPVEEFPLKRGGGYDSWCKLCRNLCRKESEARTGWSAKKTAEIKTYINSIKRNSSCTDCGKYFHPRVMEFDHIDPNTKIADIAKLSNRHNLSRVKQEIEKCEIVCTICHRIRHSGTERKYPESTNSSYMRTVLRNLEIIDSYKINPCVDCGECFPVCAMDFDHMNPEEKVLEVGALTKYSASVLLTEILKCQVVCANCHKLRTHLRPIYHREKLGDKNGISI